MPLIRSLLQRKHSLLQQTNGELCKANQSSVYQCLFQQEFDAHDALEDVLALKKILLSSALAIDTKTIVNNSNIHPACQAEADMKYLDHQQHLYESSLIVLAIEYIFINISRERAKQILANNFSRVDNARKKLN